MSWQVLAVGARSRLVVGERISYWRRISGVSQVDLAARTGIDNSAISRMEHGKQEPSASQLERIASALGLTMAQFYGDIAEPEKAAS